MKNLDYEILRGKLKLNGLNIDEYTFHPKTIFLSDITPSTATPIRYRIPSQKFWLTQEVLITGQIENLNTALSSDKKIINFKSKKGSWKVHENTEYKYITTTATAEQIFVSIHKKTILFSTGLTITIPTNNVYKKINLVTINLLVLMKKL